MSILSLSNEILLQISTYFNRQDDLWSLSLVSRRFHYDVFDDCLYRFNITHRQCKALIWAAETGHLPTVKRILDLLPSTTDINTLTKPPRPLTIPLYFSLRTKSPLYFSTLNGHLPIIDLLLQRTPNPLTREPHGASLLYAALLSANDLVIEKIISLTPDLKTHIAVPHNGYSPLHVACQFGLARWVRYFLEQGVEIETTDCKGWTALRHALELNFERFWDQQRDFRVDRVVPTAGQVRDTVRVLVEWGADPLVERGERWDWGRREWGVAVSTAAGVGRGHVDPEVRRLFKGRKDGGSESEDEEGFTGYELEYLEGKFHQSRFRDGGSRIASVNADGSEKSVLIVGDRQIQMVPPTSNMDRHMVVSSLRLSSIYLDLRPHQPSATFMDYMAFEDPGKAWLAAASENSLARYSNLESRRKAEEKATTSAV